MGKHSFPGNPPMHGRNKRFGCIAALTALVAGGILALGATTAAQASPATCGIYMAPNADQLWYAWDNSTLLYFSGTHASELCNGYNASPPYYSITLSTNTSYCLSYNSAGWAYWEYSAVGNRYCGSSYNEWTEKTSDFSGYYNIETQWTDNGVNENQCIYEYGDGNQSFMAACNPASRADSFDFVG